MKLVQNPGAVRTVPLKVEFFLTLLQQQWRLDLGLYAPCEGRV